MSDSVRSKVSGFALLAGAVVEREDGGDVILHYGSPAREQRALEDGRGVVDLSVTACGAEFSDDDHLRLGLTRPAAERLGVEFSPIGPSISRSDGTPLGTALVPRAEVDDDPAALAARLSSVGIKPVGSLAWRAELVRVGLVEARAIPAGITPATHALRRLYLEGPGAADLPESGVAVVVVPDGGGRSEPERRSAAGADGDASATDVTPEGSAPAGVILEAVRDWEDGPVALAAIRLDVDAGATVAVGDFEAYQEELDGA